MHLQNQVLEHITSRDDENSIRSCISEKVIYFQNQCESYERDLTAQISICPPTLSTNVIDEQLKRFVIFHQKSLSARIDADISKFKASIQEKQLLRILSSNRIDDEQVMHVNDINNEYSHIFYVAYKFYL